MYDIIINSWFSEDSWCCSAWTIDNGASWLSCDDWRVGIYGDQAINDDSDIISNYLTDCNGRTMTVHKINLCLANLRWTIIEYANHKVLERI
jgi:hypothetical protein